MTDTLFQSDPYLQAADAKVVSVSESGGIFLDRTLFYPTGGGQPSDTGTLAWNSAAAEVTGARKSADGGIELLVAGGQELPPAGTKIRQELDWQRRYRHMRIHTALHLLSVAIPLPVTSGAITTEKGRLDFNMPEAIEDRDGLEQQLNELVARDLPVTEDWITDDELAANPGLVKTMSVKPPMGTGLVRLIRIGSGDDQIDLQPCGGTHIRRTGEIGTITLGKIEKKGRINRRVNILVD